jgi:hypothetical protein
VVAGEVELRFGLRSRRGGNQARSETKVRSGNQRPAKPERGDSQRQPERYEHQLDPRRREAQARPLPPRPDERRDAWHPHARDDDRQHQAARQTALEVEQ